MRAIRSSDSGYLRHRIQLGNDERLLDGRSTRLASGDRRLGAIRRFLNPDLPTGDPRSRHTQALGRVGQGEVGQMTDTTAVCRMVARMVGGKRRRLQGKRACDEQEDR